MAAVELVAGAAAGYVLLRTGWIFGGVLAVAVGSVLAAAALVAWRRGHRPAAAGLLVGSLVSAVVLAA